MEISTIISSDVCWLKRRVVWSATLVIDGCYEPRAMMGSMNTGMEWNGKQEAPPQGIFSVRDWF